MDKNVDNLKKLSKLNQRWFRQDELERMEIYKEDIDDLVQKGFMGHDKKGFPETQFFLLDSSYMVIIAKETEKASEETRKLTNCMLIVAGETKQLTGELKSLTNWLIFLALIQIFLAGVQFLKMVGQI